jgi:DNA-binding transcriptional MerR regulator/methylmalonyl-CoA mutase cobalamin-binding subunit
MAPRSDYVNKLSKNNLDKLCCFTNNWGMEDWHPIKVVAHRTGLSSHVIRAWEKRYQAVEPRRTATNRRVYSGEDVERLILLRRATLAGRSIGQVASLPTGELRELVLADESAQRLAPGGVPSGRQKETSATRMLRQCLDAVEALDPDALKSSLERASVTLSRPALVQEIIGPLLHHVGEAWREGSIRVAHEHLASAIIRTFLGGMNGSFWTSREAPNLLVTTPAGQLHELGALLAATTAASEGWRITYLGPSLPADEIASAVEQSGARALALSIVYPQDDLHLKGELKGLSRLLSHESVALLVGGRGVNSYADVLEEIGAVSITDLDEFRSQLQSLRSAPMDS